MIGMLAIILRAEARARNLKRYYTGKPCKNNHSVERFVYDGGCIQCKLDASRLWKKKNQRKVNEQVKLWRSTHIEHRKAYRKKQYSIKKDEQLASCRIWRQNNLDKAKQISNAYKKSNKEKCQAKQRNWRIQNADAIRSYARLYRGKYPEVKRAAEAKRRARKVGAVGSYGRNDVLQLLVLQKKRCATCYADISSKYHIDHIRPLARGGGNSRNNIQLLCPPCNMRKSAKDPVVWARENGRLL
jgi:5-methylcytosine-specific restriction endonuclease McrA